MGHVIGGLWTIRTKFPGLTDAQRTERVRVWSLQVLEILGVGLEARGPLPPPEEGALLVANHISWLDILVMNAVRPARFVSKADVKRWPLLGSLITGAGTLYLERESRRDAMRVVHHVAERIQNNDLVAIFPEGTTGDGVALLPFHANLFQAAIAAQAPVRPVALSFVHAGTGLRHDAPTYIGDTTLLASMWATLRATDVQAVATYGPAQWSGGRSRRDWAQAVRSDIAALREGPVASATAG
ncbi:MAG: lysophospholipid acyltransferase family protein [Burkholderiaceae bacterium]